MQINIIINCPVHNNFTINYNIIDYIGQMNTSINLNHVPWKQL